MITDCWTVSGDADPTDYSYFSQSSRLGCLWYSYPVSDNVQSVVPAPVALIPKKKNPPSIKAPEDNLRYPY